MKSSTIDPRAIDITGMRFGLLTVQSSEGKRRWTCICDCGAIKSAIDGSHLRRGSIKSCGCLAKTESVRASKGKKKHGAHGTPEYHIWAGMIQRCENPKNPNYRLYGAKGISVCAEWKSFESFIADMGVRPTPAHSIERIKSSDNYCPDNCEWATDHGQTRNTSRNRNFTIDGVEMCLMDWCLKYEVDYKRVQYRLSRGHGIQESLEMCK